MKIYTVLAVKWNDELGIPKTGVVDQVHLKSRIALKSPDITTRNEIWMRLVMTSQQILS